MKIYEKPMAIIEKINVEDVITASVVTPADDFSASTGNMNTYLGGTTGNTSNATIVFEW